MKLSSILAVVLIIAVLVGVVAFTVNPGATLVHEMAQKGVLVKQLQYVEYAEEFKAIQAQLNLDHPGVRFGLQNMSVKADGSIVFSTWSFYPQYVEIDLFTMNPQTPSVTKSQAWALVDVESGCAKNITVYTRSQMAEIKNPDFPWESVNYNNSRCQWNVNLPDLPRDYQWITRMAELTQQVTPVKYITKSDFTWNMKSLK